MPWIIKFECELIVSWETADGNYKSNLVDHKKHAGEEKS